MGHVFISYSHKDTKYAHRLAASLQESGFDVWIDERLDYGSQWPHEIQKRLDTCDAFILVMSPRSFASDWVQSELQRAKRKMKPIFPLLLEGDEPWLSVESTQCYDVRDNDLPDSKFYSALKRAVHTGPDASTLEFSRKSIRKKVQREASARKPRTELLIAIVGALATVCAAVATIIGVFGNPMMYFLATSTPAPATATLAIESIPITVDVAYTQPVPSETAISISTATLTSIPTPIPTLTTTWTPVRPTWTPLPNLALYGWWSPSRNDNFATTTPGWAGSSGDVKSPDYRFVRLEGYVHSPDLPQPDGTVPLYSWWSPSRNDNFATTTPGWAGSSGDVKSPDYRFVRHEGYIYSPELSQPAGTIPLYSWWSPLRKDNVATTAGAWAGGPGDVRSPDYVFVRLEGYVRQP